MATNIYTKDGMVNEEEDKKPTAIVAKPVALPVALVSVVINNYGYFKRPGKKSKNK